MFWVGEWCDICGTEIKDEVKQVHIDGRERTACTSCCSRLESEMKVVDHLIIKGVLKQLIKLYGQNKVTEFNLHKAEEFVEVNATELSVEVLGGPFFADPTGEVIFLSTSDLLYIIRFLQRKVSRQLWMNAVMRHVLEQQITIMIEQKVKEGQRIG